MASQAANHTAHFSVKLMVGSIIFFLIFLGMRIPYLKGDFARPKQRPSATLSEASQLEGLSKSEKIVGMPLVPPMPTLAAPPESVVINLPLPTPTCPYRTTTALAPSRASPFHG